MPAVPCRRVDISREGIAEQVIAREAACLLRDTMSGSNTATHENN